MPDIQKIARLSREQLAEIGLNDPRKIKWLESLQAVAQDTPDNLDQIYQAIDEVNVQAAIAFAQANENTQLKEVYVTDSLPVIFHNAIGFEELPGYPGLYLEKVNV